LHERFGQGEAGRDLARGGEFLTRGVMQHHVQEHALAGIVAHGGATPRPIHRLRPIGPYQHTHRRVPFRAALR
jgi:hypothetical protein